MDTIRFQDVWKEYEIGFGQGGLRSALTSLPKKLLGREKKAEREHFYALREIELAVQAGEAVGLIGRNGAGKTTMLKLISGITQPTRGNVEIEGRVSALIELGAGFHPELTGRENIYLNGTILGLSRKEIARKFDEIVAFAELEKFIDTPVKRYSSGMYARLGFSVAAHTNPEVLLVDEVLAVGDRNFQEKCFEHILRFVKSKHTTVFVSHSMYTIEQLCSRVFWLDEGRVMKSGTPGEVLPAYFEFLDTLAMRERVIVDETYGKKLWISGMRCLNLKGEEVDGYKTGEEITIELSYTCKDVVRSPFFVLGVTGGRNESVLFLASMLVDGQAPETLQGEGTIRCRFHDNPLTPKVYHVWGEVWAEDRSRVLVDWHKMGSFRIFSPDLQFVGKGGIRHVRADAALQLLYDWELAHKP
jgi:lipopolysaccharide transport system ATP-binding protein